MAIRRMVLGGLAVMGVVALFAAIWPGVASFVAVLFAVLLVVVISVPTTLGVRWVRGELAWRRELRMMPPVDAAPYGAAAPVAPMLAELRESV